VLVEKIFGNERESIFIASCRAIMIGAAGAHFGSFSRITFETSPRASVMLFH
jgi:hypothetical protein